MTFKYHKVSDLCDICGRWVRVYYNFFDINGKACCVCESCYENELSKNDRDRVTHRAKCVDEEYVNARDGRAGKADASEDCCIVQTKLF